MPGKYFLKFLFRFVKTLKGIDCVRATIIHWESLSMSNIGLVVTFVILWQQLSTVNNWILLKIVHWQQFSTGYNYPFVKIVFWKQLSISNNYSLVTIIHWQQFSTGLLRNKIQSIYSRYPKELNDRNQKYSEDRAKKRKSSDNNFPVEPSSSGNNYPLATIIHWQPLYSSNNYWLVQSLSSGDC